MSPRADKRTIAIFFISLFINGIISNILLVTINSILLHYRKEGELMELTVQTILYIIGAITLGWMLSFIKSRFEVAKYKQEIKGFKEHLNRQMKITNEGNKNLEKDLEKLKKENENLRISVQTLGQKPGRAELRLLNIYDSALRKMMMKAPGFSSSWEMALQEAEAEYVANEKGFKSIIKKVFGPSLTQTTQALPGDMAELPDSYDGK
jgi:uncharacterized membrane protein YciS (DUF1049 family)